MLIDEISYLDQIFDLEKNKESLYSINVMNVSYWNSGQAYKNFILENIHLDIEHDIFDYVYTYDVPQNQRLKIMKKLGVINPEESMCFFNSTGTNTILNVINYLKLNHYKKIGILMPSYFSVEKCCQLFNLNYEKICMKYINNKYIIPVDYILEKNFDAIWITSPVYSTGISYDETQINIIKKIILKKILVIADETLALPTQMLLSKIPISDFFFSICSPHKPLYINKLKFSVLICPKKNDDVLEQWVDVLSGSLLSSNLIAIQHFLSDDFSMCINATKLWYHNAIGEISKVLEQFPYAQCNLTESSPYKTIYFQPPKKISIV